MIRHHPQRTHWSAIFSLFMGVTCLIAAEFIPVSLLTAIAEDLDITEGMAGQSVTVVGIFAVIASLSLSSLFPKTNRRNILLFLMVFLTLSNLLVAFAPNYSVLLIGRAILGICVGGFWSMTSAIILQLATQNNIPRAFSIVYAGVSVATIIALPLGSYFGNLLGWRSIFILSAIVSLLTLVWQFFALPSIQAQASSGFKEIFNLLKINWVLLGMIATVLSFGGYHVVFTYLKPFLEQSLLLDNRALTFILFMFGIANCTGTFVASLFLGKLFRSTMIIIHLSLMVIACLLLITSNQSLLNTVWVILWGFIFGFIPVAWSTWITRTLAEKAEFLGGLSVAAIQLSIGLAALFGGLIFDHFSMQGIFVVAIIATFICACFIHASFKTFYRVMGHNV